MPPTFKYYAEGRHATWLELFFDLVFVASISVITHHLAHVHDGHLEGKWVMLYFTEFIPVWWIWASHTLYANRFDTDSRTHRVASLVIMFLMTTLSAFLGAGFLEDSARFIVYYGVIRAVLTAMYLSTSYRFKQTQPYTQRMGVMILGGVAIAFLSLPFGNLLRQIIFLGSIGLEMIATAYLSTGGDLKPIHREHLVERVGLLSIILLGESVISLVGGLSNLEWDQFDMVAALTGFLMIGAIWWIYFDGFPLLERAKQIKYGFPLLYSHVLFLLGMGILSSLIRHAILNDVAMGDFRGLAIAGMTLFYLGKQISYYLAIPTVRSIIVINTVVCISVTVFSTFLPRPEYTLIGITLGMLFYVYSNFRWTLTKDVSEYLSDVEPSSQSLLA
ncbi:MAG: low temperature requirement protein A [Leptolyngbya sp. SIO1D8]|nr:low temperature requirement protein A [Leptolyngbya sp. SIO1D8]